MATVPDLTINGVAFFTARGSLQRTPQAWTSPGAPYDYTVEVVIATPLQARTLQAAAAGGGVTIGFPSGETVNDCFVDLDRAPGLHWPDVCTLTVSTSVRRIT